MSSGIKSSIRGAVTVTPGPDPDPSGSVSASFTWVPGSADGVVSFQATAQSTLGQITAYEWAFGDGTSATGPAVSHTYAGDGPYVVTLIVRDETGASARVDKTVTPPDVPTAGVISASFTATNSTTVSRMVNFAATASTTVGTISSYQWDFGDGSTGTGQTTAHTYADTATYTVTLTVRDSTGSSKVVTKNVTPQNQNVTFPLKIIVKHTDRFADRPYVTTATAIASSPAGAITGYRWTWQGGSADGSNATLDFGAPGTYLVTCTATDSAGNTALASTTLVVEPAATIQTLEVSGEFIFRSANEMDPPAYTWGDLQETLYVYQEDGGDTPRNVAVRAHGEAIFRYDGGLPAGARLVGAAIVGRAMIDGSQYAHITSSNPYNGVSALRITATSEGATLGSLSLKVIDADLSIGADFGRVSLDLVSLPSTPVTVTLDIPGAYISDYAGAVLNMRLKAPKLVVTYRN
ncbi:PKD domain-containing protein [Deinococcus sp. S9]|uniref:PKD domain-containing protein n=1 Tax=Deinococcus sp. S9 TaxID=2545754 RepID=UPI0010562783|nr:PKD domain-containing protein [Deinococcus sp. S9]TDE85564.1 PKD domain-containing protein [Deinococcus sp. S9]